jgi:4-carboxymuconolactone decarboxylase
MLEHVVPLIEAADVPEADRARFDKIAAARGSVPNVFKALGNSPATMEAVGDLGAHMRFGSLLPHELREVVVLTIARATSCAYEWTHHWHVAHRLQVDEALLDAVAAGEGADAPAPIGAAVRTAESMVRNELPDEADVQVLRDSLGRDGLVDLLVLIGHYRLLAGVILVLGVPLEPGLEVVPFTGPVAS